MASLLAYLTPDAALLRSVLGEALNSKGGSTDPFNFIQKYNWAQSWENLAQILAPIFQRVDNSIHYINRCLVDECRQTKLRYPLDSDLSGG